MATVVEICNRALGKLGAKRITSLTQDSATARAMNASFNSLRDALLEEYVWSFAIARAEIAAESAAPDWGRGYAYVLPSDYIRMANQYPEQALQRPDWEIEGQKILSDDSGPIQIRYVSRVTDPNVMTPLFREALAAYLAMELCEELTQSNTKKADLKDDFNRIIAKARRTNAIQKAPIVPQTDDWISARW